MASPSQTTNGPFRDDRSDGRRRGGLRRGRESRSSAAAPDAPSAGPGGDATSALAGVTLPVAGASPAAALSAGLLAAALSVAPASAQRAMPLQEREPDTVTYREGLELAQRQSLDVRRARRTVDLRSTETTRQGMDFLPSLDLTAGATRTFGRSFSQQEGQILSQTSDFVDVGGTASIELFNGFERWASLEEAKHAEEASRRQVDRARRDVAFQTLDLFSTLLQNRELTQVRRQELQAQEDLLRQVRGLVEVGRQPKSDLYQQQAARAEAEAALVEAQRQEGLVETELIRFLQLDPAGSYEFVAPSFPDSVTAPADSFRLRSLLETAMEERADLRAQAELVEAREQSVRAANSGYWPSLSLSFDYGSDWSSNARRPVPGTGSDPRTVTLEPDDGGEPVTIEVPGTGEQPQFVQPDFMDQIRDRRGGGVRLSLNVPVFDRLQTRTQVASARAQRDNAWYDLRDLRQTVALEVRQALLEYRSAQAQLSAAGERLEAARRAREAARRRYELGAATFVELSEANSSFVSAKSAYVRAHYTMVRARELIEHRTGTLELDVDPGAQD